MSKIIKKGRLNHPKIEGFVQPIQYILTVESGQKKLLMRFENNSDEDVSGVTLKITQKDYYNRNIGTITADCRVVRGVKRQPFVIEDKIVLDPDCVSFTVKVVSAHFDEYTLINNDGELELLHQTHNYNPKSQIEVNRKNSLTNRSFKVSGFVCFSIALMMVFSALIAYFEIGIHRQKYDTFFHKGVEYAFVNNDKSFESDIFVVGARASAKNITIYESIRGHKVSHIEDEAFKGSRIKNLVIKADVLIGENMFAYSTLESVVIEKSNAIAVGAFNGCSALKSFTAYNLSHISVSAFGACSSLETITLSNSTSVLQVENGAFLGCDNIKNVDIDQYINYDYNEKIFPSPKNIESLRVKNFNYSFTYEGEHYEDTTKTIAEFFGANPSQIMLKQLQIDNIDEIPADFAQGLSIRKVKIGRLTNRVIPQNAFLGCTYLADFSADVPITRVDDNAFNQTAIKSFDGRNLTHIGNYAFASCISLTQFNLTNNNTLVFLGEGAFYDCLNLDNLYISGFIDVVLPKVFYNCKGLKTIEFGGDLIRIESEAFLGCELLEGLPLSDSLVYIGEYAFNKAGLKHLVVPNSVVEIGVGAFASTKLEELVLPFIGGTRGDTNRFMHVFESDMNLPKTLKIVTIQYAPVITPYAFFNCTAIERIIIQTDFTQIGEYAFANCKRLNEFILPATLQNIGENAFYNCYKLYELFNLSQLKIGEGSTVHGYAGFNALKVYTSFAQTRIPKLTTSQGLEFAVDLFGEWYLINYFGSEPNVDLPTEFTYAGNRIGSYSVIKYMAENNDVLVKLSVPDTVHQIQTGAFSDCLALTDVVVGNVNSIQSGVFAGSPIANISLPYLGSSHTKQERMEYFFVREYQSSTVVSLLKKIQITYASVIPENAFLDCHSVTEIEIISPFTQIKAGAFANCFALEKFTFPDSLVAIGADAFSSCTSLSEIVVPQSVTSIGVGAFSNCTGLRSVTLPFTGESEGSTAGFKHIFGSGDHVSANQVTAITITKSTEIPQSAFSGLKGLVSVSIKNAQTIGKSAFSGCSLLENVEVGGQLTTIHAEAFSGCIVLKSFYLPASVTKIYDNAFANCHALFQIYNLSSLALEVGSTSYGQVAYNALIIHKSLSAELLTQVYVDNVLYMYSGDSWIAVGYAMLGEKLTLDSFKYNGKTVSNISIKKWAFSRSYINEVVLGSAVKSIGEGAFSNCIYLRTVTLKDSALTTIPKEAFSGCVSLINLQLPNSVETIKNEAFLNCFYLLAVTLPQTVTSIEYGAFLNCYSLVDVSNKSKLNITQGTSDFGFVGYYAQRVSSDDLLNRVEYNGNIFINFYGVWQLVYVNPNVSYLSLPDLVSVGNTTIYSYTLNECAIANRPIYSIKIPMAVTGYISGKSLMTINVEVVYFYGTQPQWFDFALGTSLYGLMIVYNS